MASATTVAHSLHVNWSRWFHCESSFDLPLVPQAPGLYAVSRKGKKNRELTIMRVEAVDSLFHSLSALFADAALREEFAEGDCLVRYAEVADSVLRQGACAILQDWVAGRVPPQVMPGLIEEFLATESSASR